MWGLELLRHTRWHKEPWGRRRGVINFDGAAKNNPGRARCAATLSTREIPHAQVAADSEFMGIQTNNNVVEYAGMILGARPWSN